MRPLRIALFGILTLAAPALVACGPWAASGSHPAPTHPSEAAKPLGLSITPPSGTARAPVSTEVGLSVTNGTVASVLMTRSDGAPVSGAMRDDGSSWIPNQ